MYLGPLTAFYDSLDNTLTRQLFTFCFRVIVFLHGLTHRVHVLYVNLVFRIKQTVYYSCENKIINVSRWKPVQVHYPGGWWPSYPYSNAIRNNGQWMVFPNNVKNRKTSYITATLPHTVSNRIKTSPFILSTSHGDNICSCPLYM
jgi:hypothetical protein